MKRKGITKAEWSSLGGVTNPKLYHTMLGGYWHYWIEL